MRVLGEEKCRIKGCGAAAIPDAREKHGAGFQGLCTSHIDSQKEREKKSGSHQQSIRRIMNKETLASRIVNDLINEDEVTTSLSNIDMAEQIARKLWGNYVSHVDIQRSTDAFYEFNVILDNGQTNLLRQYRQGRWWYFDHKERDWKYATDY